MQNTFHHAAHAQGHIPENPPDGICTCQPAHPSQQQAAKDNLLSGHAAVRLEQLIEVVVMVPGRIAGEFWDRHQALDAK